MTKNRARFIVGCLIYLACYVTVGLLGSDSLDRIMMTLSAPGWYAVLPGVFVYMLASGDNLDIHPNDELTGFVQMVFSCAFVIMNTVIYGLLVLTIGYLYDEVIKHP